MQQRRWVLQEAGVEFTAIDRRELGGADELRKLHPLVKVPVAVIVGWCVNWARRQGHLDECPALGRYLQRLLARPHCALTRD